MKPDRLPIILAVDFDGTLVNSHPFPQIKGLRKGAKKYINKLADLGYYVIIWTCRTDKVSTYCFDATDALDYLVNNAIPYDRFNSNHPALMKAFGNDSRKAGADYYIDDKGLWPFGIPSWFWLYWLIRFKSFFLKENRKILSHCKPEHFN